MRNLRKKIREYDNHLKEARFMEEGMKRTIIAVKDNMAKQKDRTLSYAEFLFLQSYFIQKRWWVLQTLFLLGLWILLGDKSDEAYLFRLLGMGAPLFVSLILPEIWKNRRYYSMEIERSSFYSIRQIYSARMVLFAFVDILLLTLFLGVSGLDLEIFIINFILPLNICCSICFRLLYAPRASIELTVFAFVVWTGLWIAILMNDAWYQRFILPMWGLYFTLSLAYLIFNIYKLQTVEEEMICSWK